MANDPTTIDWVLWLGGALVGVLGGLLFVSGFWIDRARGRKRCPRCWYDMGGTPGLRCSECGHAARSERDLARTRKRFGRAILGAVVALAGYGTFKAPQVRRGNWTALVPTTALVIFAPLEYPRTGTPVAIMGANGRTSFQQSVGDNLSVEEEISKATWEEVLGGALPMWQTRIFVERWMTQQSTRPRDLLSVPARWVRGADVPIVIRGQWVTTPFGATTVLEAQKLATTGASWGRAMMVEWIPGAAGGNSITVPLKIIHSGRILYHRDLQFPIVLVDSDAELLEHLTDDASTALVKRALDVRLVRDEHGVDVVAGDRGDADPWDKIDFGLGFRVDVLFDGTPVGTGAGLVVWDYAVWKNYQEVQMNWVGDGLERVMREPGRSRFIVLGDPGAAGAQYRDFPFNKPRTAVWNGRFESPARIDPWRIPPRGAGG